MGEACVAGRPPLVRRRAGAGDNPQIAAIWDEAAACPHLTTDTEPRTAADQRAWLEGHDHDHPVIVMADGDEVLAYGSFSPYRDKPAFRATVEDSVYVKAGRRGAGLGGRVLAELLRLGGSRARAGTARSWTSRSCDPAEGDLRTGSRGPWTQPNDSYAWQGGRGTRPRRVAQ